MTAPSDANRTPGRRAAPPPRYQQITDTLLDEIDSGKYPVGSTLPSEIELSERFRVSRFTMREALRRLRDLGLVTRRRGAGTVVIATQARGPYVQTLNSTAELLQYPPETQLTLLSSAPVRADRSLANLLHCRLGQAWVRISGMRHAGGPPLCWTDVYVVPEYAGLAEILGDGRQPVYRILEDRFGESVSSVRVDLFAAATPEALAAPLGVEAGAPALCIVRRYTGQRRRVFEVSVSIHPAGRFVYSMDLHRQWSPG